MHVRNIYNTPANFVDLAKKYDFFAPFLTLDVLGNAKINFKDEAALRALSRALLLQDFNLDVHIPENVLVPTIPLRLNYILWIEDLLTLNNSLEVGKVTGIDIGTGATSIYALLGARKNKWRMIGTEINPESIKNAQENVDRNKLSELVKIIEAKPDSVFGEVLKQAADGQYYFTMCNPPFFSNEEETNSVMKGRFSEDKPLRSPPSAVKTGEKTELVIEGGELKFVDDIIRESLKFPRKVRIYTTMIGIKRHLKQLTSSLRAHEVVNYTTTEFIQGKTMRWGLAWSFYPGVQLFTSHPDILGAFPDFSTLLNFETLIHSYLTELHLHTLEWLPTVITDEDAPKVLEVIATENTWSHQRRLRREMERKKREGLDTETAATKSGPSPPKLIKLSTEEGKQDSAMECDAVGSPNGSRNSQILIHFIMDFVREGTDAQLIMRFRDGSLGKDGMNQIMQFLKNRFTKDCNDPASFVYQILSSAT